MLTAGPIKIKSVVAVQEDGRLFGKTFRDRVWSLEKDQLTMTINKANKTVTIKQGCVWHNVKYGFQVLTQDGEWIHATVHNKAQWATWLQAVQNLAPAQPHSPTKVHFSDDVHVRFIPSDDESDMTPMSSDDED
ncbi:hypothetical protein AC1031_007685 [Aphanomyces cochlioides]|nr:hypothetical protein AC1031_007685 [Aphanomyces cochlioides]